MPDRIGGLTDVLEQQVDLLGQTLYHQRQHFLGLLGDPWGRKRVSEADAVARILDWDEKPQQYVQQAQKLSDGQLAEAAMESVRLVQQAVRRGEEQATLYVQRKTTLPSVILETAPTSTMVVP